MFPAWKKAIPPREAHELFHLLSTMHALSLLDGIAPTREHFRRVARVTDKAFLKFFADYTETVYACGYSLSKVKNIVEARARRAAVRGMMNREFTPRPTRKPVPIGHENLFGERIEGYELLHAPVNEQGVVVLFAMMAKKLGFLIELVRQGYPDCEAKRRGPDNKWRRVRIEFEYCTSRFNHDPAGCDLVVCWVNDSRKCPVDVLELKSEIARLAQANAESASGVSKRSNRASRVSERSES